MRCNLDACMRLSNVYIASYHLYLIMSSAILRYTALQKNCTNRQEWSHEEDLDLLRGYQIYGDKWPLISIFFFPHRCRKELKAR